MSVTVADRVVYFGGFSTGQLSPRVSPRVSSSHARFWHVRRDDEHLSEPVGGTSRAHGALPPPSSPQLLPLKPREMSTYAGIPEFLLEVSIVVIAVVSLLTNVSVLLCLTQSAELRSHVPGLFILNLSFSNILLAIVNMPATFLGVDQSAKPFGHLFCQAVSFAETFLTTNAMLSMAALSVDRWIAVVFPLSYSSKMRYRDALLIVAYSWLHSLAFSVSQLLMDWGGYSHTYASCTLHLAGEERSMQLAAYTTFTVLFHLSSFALCLFVLCFAYLKVLRVARSHCKRIDVITVQTLLLLVDIHPSVKERCLAEQKKRRQRATKKICIFIGSFILCYSPYVITRLLELLPSMHIPRYIGITTKCLSYAKASSDPFVYCLLRHQYRKVLVSIIGRVLRQDRYSLSAHSISSTLDTADDSCIARIT
ncbi:G-protein coupled receptor 26 [Platichthys flesus]|uniref:G-protein coupled receptor 26 n=1 Tax=Platichthys flesus TaxID=8260 RepID=UPI002DB948F2|nr:G-protein coupled receptor 26 [Platichthys flesus]